jgi:hypothetical protein
MKNTIISEGRAVRKKLDKESVKNPSRAKRRWMEIEKKYNVKIVYRGPKHFDNAI